MLKEPPELIIGAGGVLLRDGKVLLVVEDQSDERYGKKAGMLSVPMGRIELGKGPKETAEREFEEETGLKVSTTQFINKFLLPPAGAVFLFLVQLDGRPEEKQGNLPCLWMEINKFLSLPEEKVRPPSKVAVKLFLQYKDDTS